jgi:hypothetical protein
MAGNILPAIFLSITNCMNDTAHTALLTMIKQSTDYQTNKRILREKVQTDLCLPYNGGMFAVDMTLLSFLATWEDDELYIEDTYQNPIRVNRLELLTLARAHYQKVMNYWHIQHDELKRRRKV